MTYSDDLDFQYAAVDPEQAKRMIIEHTTDKWETAKTALSKLGYMLGVGAMIFVFWQIWGIFFWVAFFASLPFTYIVARKLVKIPIRWFMQIDVRQPRFNLFGIPKSWSWSGDSLPATDNADNSISIVRTIKSQPHLRKVTTTMSSGDFDRLEFINDAKTLDRVVEDKERLTAYVHFLKRNFWNEVISKITDLQEAAVIRPINEILRKEMIDLNMTPSVGKSSATETPKGDDFD